MNLIICIRFLLDTLVLYLQGAQKRSGPGKHVFLSFFLSFFRGGHRSPSLPPARDGAGRTIALGMTLRVVMQHATRYYEDRTWKP